MGVLGLVLLLSAADPDEGLAKKMLPIYLKEVETYSLSVESAPKKALELKKEPVFEWLNPARNTQQGAVFLWLCDGRPAALACVFSHPHEKLPGRQVMHELHALDSEKLLVKRDEYNQWKPEAGFARKELPDARAPAATAGARLLQMRPGGVHRLQRRSRRSDGSCDCCRRRSAATRPPTPVWTARSSPHVERRHRP